MFHDVLNDRTDLIVIPVNLQTRSNGDAVMGAGLALAAAQKYPWLPATLGLAIRRRDVGLGHSVILPTATAQRLVCFPTKFHWKYCSNLEWIADGLYDLVSRVAGCSISFPRLGCGLGSLHWPTVQLMIADYFRNHDASVLIDGTLYQGLRPLDLVGPECD